MFFFFLKQLYYLYKPIILYFNYVKIITSFNSINNKQLFLFYNLLSIIVTLRISFKLFRLSKIN